MHTLTFPDMHGVVTGCQSSDRHSGLRRCLSPESVTFFVRIGFPPATSTCEEINTNENGETKRETRYI